MPILADPDESASPWRWVRRLLPLVAMGVGVGLQPGSLVIFSGAAALDPHSAIIFFGAIVRACHDGVACFQWYEEEIGCHHMFRGDFVAIHPSLQKVDRSKLFEVFRLMVSYSIDRKLHRQEEFCRAMLLRCNASCVPQRCGLNISLFEDENAQEFNVITYETVENRGIYNKPCVRYDERAGGACTVQNSAATVASQEGHIRLIRRCFYCRVPQKHTVPIKDSYGTAWIF